MLSINEETRNCLSTLFQSVERFETEFPTLSKCIVEYEDDNLPYELDLYYHEEDRVLYVHGYIPIPVDSSLLCAQLIITKNDELLFEKKYNMMDEKTWYLEEEVPITIMQPQGLKAKVTFLNAQARTSSKKSLMSSQNACTFALHQMVAVSRNGVSFVKEVKVEHPHRDNYMDGPVTILYGAPGGNPYDYNYRESQMMLPIAIKFKTNGTIGNITVKVNNLFFEGHTSITYNGANVRIMNKHEWDMYPQKQLYPNFGSINENDYLLLIPLCWGVASSQIQNDTYAIYGSFELKGDTFEQPFFIKSVTQPQPYHAYTAEIPYIKIKQDCVEHTTLVSVLKENSILQKPISEVLIG